MSATTETPGDGSQGTGARGLVVRNTLLLVLAQVIGTPLSVVINALMARYLGPEAFGYIYLATTMAAFGFLVVEWGQSGVLPAGIARDRSRAGLFLGTALLWRGGAIGVVYLALIGVSRLLGYDASFEVTLSLVVLGAAFSSIVAVCLDAIRGFERTDISAYAHVGQQLLVAAFVVPTLLLGGGLRSTLLAQACAYACVLILVVRALRSIDVGQLRATFEAAKGLVREGTPFLFLSLVLILQPIIDSLMLSKLSTPESMGWHAAARKLVGVLVFPAIALINALYPTLSRLFRENIDEYRGLMSGVLRTATIAVVPVALGTYLFADVGILIFSQETFGPAEDNLRVFSAFVFLLYFSMVLGSALAAAGKQRAWAAVQLACVLVSVVANPFLIPYFERRFGNGGLGVCVSSVLSEVLMVMAGLWLTPKGVLNRALLVGVARAVGSGAVMVGVAEALRGWGALFALPASCGGYLLALRLSGGLDSQQIALLRSVMKRKGSG